MADFDRDSMLEMFLFEMNNLVDQLEQIIIESESGFSMDLINEIFRIMHTIKGSAAMMLFDTIATATHAAEDLFYYLRDENPAGVDYSELTDYVLSCLDFIKGELSKIEDKEPVDGDPLPVAAKINALLGRLKSGAAAPVAAQPAPAPNPDAIAPPPPPEIPAIIAPAKPIGRGTRYQARIFFIAGAEMENVRAFAAINNMKPFVENMTHVPDDIMNEAAIDIIRANGFLMDFYTEKTTEEITEIINRTVYLSDCHLQIIDDTAMAAPADLPAAKKEIVANEFSISMKFTEGSEMENVRAFSVVFSLSPKCDSITHSPANLIDENCITQIRQNGFRMDVVTTLSYDEVYDLLNKTIYLKELIVTDTSQKNIESTIAAASADAATIENITENEISSPVGMVDDFDAVDTRSQTAKKPTGAAVISVNVNKLDQLLKQMGELVIAEAMVTQNPDLEGLQLEGFTKEARQLAKIIKEVQDTVMDMRMVSLTQTFFRMNRIVRDMCKALNKEASLEIYGENTEVDKTIIEHIGDPLMHIIRNSVDHGIESPAERVRKGKPEKGTIRLEAKNVGSEVHVIIQDDGAGLKRDKIMDKARQNGLLRKPENEYSDREIFQFIFMPGFSTNDTVTSYSGRGVGMDVVNSNLELMNGSIVVDSEIDEGSSFTLKIPLSLAIIQGMIVRIADAKYTVPVGAIRDNIRPKVEDVFIDPSGNEMITVRGEHYNVVRLSEIFAIEGEVRSIEDGIMMIIENGDDAICLLVDELLGEQAVVSKPIPKYIKKVRGISGCTILGNGDISLIIEVAGFFDK